MNRNEEVSRTVSGSLAGRLSRRRARLLIFVRAAALAVVSLGLLSRMSSAASPNKNRPETAPGMDRCRCWILLDIESFYCAPCLEPLLDLCRALPARVQEDRVLGVLVYEAAGGSERSELRSRIVLKKWQGFRKTHDIRFPAVADTGPFFRGFLKDAIVVLLAHEGRNVLLSYSLPLQAGQLDEIVEILLDRAEGPENFSRPPPPGDDGTAAADELE
jgi:hypothetical protein